MVSLQWQASQDKFLPLFILLSDIRRLAHSAESRATPRNWMRIRYTLGSGALKKEDPRQETRSTPVTSASRSAAGIGSRNSLVRATEALCGSRNANKASALGAERSAYSQPSQSSKIKITVSRPTRDPIDNRGIPLPAFAGAPVCRYAARRYLGATLLAVMMHCCLIYTALCRNEDRIGCSGNIRVLVAGHRFFGLHHLPEFSKVIYPTYMQPMGVFEVTMGFGLLIKGLKGSAAATS
jgi:hypothetical protein